MPTGSTRSSGGSRPAAGDRHGPPPGRGPKSTPSCPGIRSVGRDRPRRHEEGTDGALGVPKHGGRSAVNPLPAAARRSIGRKVRICATEPGHLGPSLVPVTAPLGPAAASMAQPNTSPSHGNAVLFRGRRARVGDRPVVLRDRAEAPTAARSSLRPNACGKGGPASSGRACRVGRAVAPNRTVGAGTGSPSRSERPRRPGPFRTAGVTAPIRAVGVRQHADGRRPASGEESKPGLRRGVRGRAPGCGCRPRP